MDQFTIDCREYSKTSPATSGQYDCDDILLSPDIEFVASPLCLLAGYKQRAAANAENDCSGPANQQWCWYKLPQDDRNNDAHQQADYQLRNGLPLQQSNLVSAQQLLIVGLAGTAGFVHRHVKCLKFRICQRRGLFVAAFYFHISGLAQSIVISAEYVSTQ